MTRWTVLVWLLSVIIAQGARDTTAVPAIEWSFNDGLAGTTQDGRLAPNTRSASAHVPGVEGTALAVRPDDPVTYRIPMERCDAAALSFHYRLPTNAPPRTEILRLGGHSLVYEKHRLYWYRPEDTQAVDRATVPLHSMLHADRFVLVELGWAPGEPTWIFIDGRGATHMVASDTDGAPQAATLSFLSGTFDEVRLEPDPTRAGGRYRGVIELERFDQATLPERYAWYNRRNDVRLVDGFNGTPGALAGPLKDGRYFSVYLPVGYFRVTPDTAVCAAFRSSNGSCATCFVRHWPKREKHANHWLRKGIPAGTWTVRKIPLIRYGLEPGFVAFGFSFGTRGPAERTMAIDNVCLIQGDDTVPPERVTGLQAATRPDGVYLNWNYACDNICVAGYRVYWANVPDLRMSDDEVVGQTLETEFVHRHVTHAGTWYYAVAAVDAWGNVGPAAEVVQVEVGE